MTIYILKILAVAVILTAMILLLFGINRLFDGDYRHEKADTDSLKKEVEDSRSVISRHNLFNKFLSGDRNKQ